MSAPEGWYTFRYRFWYIIALPSTIVATSDTLDGVKDDLNDLIRAQVDFAFSHGNLDYLYHPAPADVWKEFYRCKCAKEQKIKLSAPTGKKPHAFIPPWIIAKMCVSGEACRV
jgi:hypothetical protein